MAVVTAGELDDLGPFRIAPGNPQGRHRRLGAGRGQADRVNRRNGIDDHSRQLNLFGSRCAKTCSAFDRVFKGAHDLRVGMAGNQRAPRADIIDVLFAIRVNHPTATTTLDKARRAVYRPPGAHRTVDSARYDFLALAKKLI